MRRWLYGAAVLGAALLLVGAPAQADDVTPAGTLPDIPALTPGSLPQLPGLGGLGGLPLGGPSAPGGVQDTSREHNARTLPAPATTAPVPTERPFRGGGRPVAGEDADFR